MNKEEKILFDIFGGNCDCGCGDKMTEETMRMILRRPDTDQDHLEMRNEIYRSWREIEKLKGEIRELAEWANVDLDGFFPGEDFD